MESVAAIIYACNCI